MVREGAFREDLLYRLSILTVELPSLREREGDPLFFARYYLDECLSKFPGGPEGFTPQAEHFIESYSWPGNIRQLKNAVYSAYYATEHPRIDVDHFPSYALRTSERIGNASAAQSVDSGVARSCVASQADGWDGPLDSSHAPAEGEEDKEPNAFADKEDVLGAIEHAAHPLSMAQTEKATIQLAMRHAEGNVKNAAAMLGISKATLYRKLKEFGLE